MNQDEVDYLVREAKAASKRAYAPYSKFRVGAAILTKDGNLADGCNVENASYGLTMCAERVAVGNMVVCDTDQRIVAVAIYTPTREYTSPCGACRQVLREFGQYATVILACDEGEPYITSMTELLPMSFGPENLT